MLVAAALLCLPLCVQAGQQPGTVQSEPDTVWSGHFHDNSITDVAFSHDGALVASAGLDKKINVIRTATGELVQSIEVPVYPYRLVFGVHGEGLYSCGLGRNVHLWNPETGEQKRVYSVAGHTIADTTKLGINDMSLSKDGRYLVTCAFYDVVVTDLQTGAEIQKFTPEGKPMRGSSVCISPDAASMAVGSDLGMIYTVDIQSGAIRDTMRYSSIVKGGVLYSPDGTLIAAGNMSKEGDGYVLLLDAATLQQKFRLEVEAAAQDMAFSPGGRYLLAASNDGYIYVWNTGSGELVRQYSLVGPFGPVEQGCIAVSPDSSHILSSLADNGVYLWNAAWSNATGIKETAFTDAVSIATDDACTMLRLCFTVEAPLAVTTDIVDRQGRVVATQTSNCARGMQDETIAISPLAQGMYYCRLRAGAHTIVKPFVISR